VASLLYIRSSVDHYNGRVIFEFNDVNYCIQKNDYERYGLSAASYIILSIFVYLMILLQQQVLTFARKYALEHFCHCV